MNTYADRFEIYYIRHGDTSGATHAERDTCDVDLTPLGEKQAELVGERFKGKRFDAVISSPLVRAVKTAAAVARQLDGAPTVEIIPELLENGSTYGYRGCGVDYLKRYYPNITLTNGCIFGEDEPIPNLSDEENDARAEKIIEYLRSRFTYGQRIIVVAHGSFGNHFIPAAVGMKTGDFILSINNTSVSKIKYTDDGDKRISFMNDMSHLRPLMPDYETEV